MKIEVDIPEATVAQIIKRSTKSASITGRQITLTDDQRRSIEAIFQTTIADGDDLVKRVRSLSVIKIGNVEHVFAPDELARFQMQATFHGRTLETFIKEMVDEVASRMLERV